ncbi:MAG: biotin--[Clostridia bacterium]|nr:biotin--[acetyl-CoA-carboxylase] ligase [Clostridia bacterium]
MQDSISPVLWQPLLATKHLGRAVNHCEHTLSSTNTVLKDMARQGAPHGSVCLCECQTSGRGRLDRQWSSPDGQGVWISVLLRPRLSPEQLPLITFCTAMAMAQAIRDCCGVDARIKWPNDLVLQGRKVCGILLEMVITPEGIAVIAGTGLNVHHGAYPPELADRAIALDELCTPPQRAKIIASYLCALEKAIEALEQDGFPGIETDYRLQSCTLGSQVHVLATDSSFTGIAEAIDESGALLVRMQDGQLRRVLAGDVSVRGVMGYV